MTDAIVGILIICGGAFTAIAGLGLIRFPDVLMRMHASTKAGTLGVGLIVTGVAVHFNDALAVAKALLVIVFLLLTAPVAAHLIGRASYRSGLPLSKGTRMLDEPMKRKTDQG